MLLRNVFSAKGFAVDVAVNDSDYLDTEIQLRKSADNGTKSATAEVEAANREAFRLSLLAKYVSQGYAFDPRGGITGTKTVMMPVLDAEGKPTNKTYPTIRGVWHPQKDEGAEELTPDEQFWGYGELSPTERGQFSSGALSRRFNLG